MQGTNGIDEPVMRENDSGGMIATHYIEYILPITQSYQIYAMQYLNRTDLVL